MREMPGRARRGTPSRESPCTGEGRQRFRGEQELQCGTVLRRMAAQRGSRGAFGSVTRIGERVRATVGREVARMRRQV